MKAWHETAAVLDRLQKLALQGKSAALATVVRIDGSAYRRPGAKLMVASDGVCVGGVSGGCLEADVREVSASVIKTGKPRLLQYDMQDANNVLGLGLGCQGAVDVFVQPGTGQENAAARARILEFLSGDQTFAIATVTGGPEAGRTLVVDPDGGMTGNTGDPEFDRQATAHARSALAEAQTRITQLGDATMFTEVLVPPPVMVVFGAGDDSVPLAGVASQTGFRVVVVDHRPATLSPGRFPAGTRLVQRRPEDGSADLPLHDRTYAVIKMHSLAHDRAWLGQVLGTSVAYVGVLGPRSRTMGMLDDLHADADRVYSPVGLDLGADGPEQVAVAIVGEALAVRAGRIPDHLRQRAGAIHAG